jgi:hypothetical protein
MKLMNFTINCNAVSSVYVCTAMAITAEQFRTDHAKYGKDWRNQNDVVQCSCYLHMVRVLALIVSWQDSRSSHFKWLCAYDVNTYRICLFVVCRLPNNSGALPQQVFEVDLESEGKDEVGQLSFRVFCNFNLFQRTYIMTAVAGVMRVYHIARRRLQTGFS